MATYFVVTIDEDDDGQFVEVANHGDTLRKSVGADVGPCYRAESAELGEMLAAFVAGGAVVMPSVVRAQLDAQRVATQKATDATTEVGNVSEARRVALVNAEQRAQRLEQELGETQVANGELRDRLFHMERDTERSEVGWLRSMVERLIAERGPSAGPVSP